MRRMISQKDQNKIENISFGADLTSTNKYQLDSFEFVAGTSDVNSYIKFNIKKFQAGNQRRYALVTGPLVDLSAGTIVITGITEVENWNSWNAYNGIIELNDGELAKSEGADGDTYVCRIGNTYKCLSYDSSVAGGKLYGVNVQAVATSEFGQIKVVPVSADGYTIIKRKVVLSTAA